MNVHCTQIHTGGAQDDRADTSVEGRELWFVNGYTRIKLSSRDNADGLSILEHRLPFGDAPPRHIHHTEDEVFHLISGRMKFVVGGVERVAEAGETVLAPQGVWHGFRVISPEGAHVLTVTRPAAHGGFEGMVRAVSRPATAPVIPPMVEPTPEMQGQLARAAAERGIDLIGPPIQ